MEFIELGVRIHLDRLRVIRQDDGAIAGSADEPYLWVVFLKVDGTTVQENAPQNAEVALHAPSPAPGNLGPASQGVAAGEVITIPSGIGTFETTLRGATGSMLGLTRFSTIAVIVGALEHDESRAKDIIEIHGVVVREAKRRLDRELRRIVQEAVDGNLPTADEVRERLEDQISYKVIKGIIDEHASGLIGEPINLLNQDVFVGYNADQVFTFPRLLATSLAGVDFSLELTRRSEEAPNRARYRVSGGVERTDIREPPTLGLVHLDGNRVRISARGFGKKVWVREWAGGTWSAERATGAGLLSSGPAIAASADGSPMYTAGRGLNKRIWVHWGSGDGWKQLFDRKFATGAGIACSANGRIVFVMATGEDRNVYATFNLQGGDDWSVDWRPMGVRSLASPALACSADGTKLFMITLGEDRRLYESIFDVGLQKLAPKITVPLGTETFRSAPACACSDDGRRVWFAACGDDGKLRINKPKLKDGETSIWAEFGGEFASAPALACSPDGNRIHIAAIDMSLRLRHRFSTDSGESWPERNGERWEVLAENAAWF